MTAKKKPVSKSQEKRLKAQTDSLQPTNADLHARILALEKRFEALVRDVGVLEDGFRFVAKETKSAFGLTHVSNIFAAIVAKFK